MGVRQSHLMLHGGNAAAAEFQKFIDCWSGVEFSRGELARLGLACAYDQIARNLLERVN
jgi:hypothetical protein